MGIDLSGPDFESCDLAFVIDPRTHEFHIYKDRRGSTVPQALVASEFAVLVEKTAIANARIRLHPKGGRPKLKILVGVDPLPPLASEVPVALLDRLVAAAGEFGALGAPESYEETAEQHAARMRLRDACLAVCEATK